MLVFWVVLCCLYKKGIGNSVSLFLCSIVQLSFIIFCHLMWLYVVLCDSFLMWLYVVLCDSFFFLFSFFFFNYLLVIELASIDSSPTHTLWDQLGFSIVAAIWLSKCYFCPCFPVAPIGPPSQWSSCCSIGPQTGNSSPFRLFFFFFGSSILVVIEFYGVIV